MTIQLPSPDDISEQSVETILNRREANLGSRYRRTSRGGLNPTTERVTVQWTLLTADEAIALYDAIKATAGVETIQFTLKDELTARNFLLDVESREYIATTRETVTATLLERHLP